jgi:hypothetical protein
MTWVFRRQECFGPAVEIVRPVQREATATYLRQIFPNANQQKAIDQIRTEIYSDLETIRGLRNRMAHHEPVIARQLHVDFNKIHALLELRSHRGVDVGDDGTCPYDNQEPAVKSSAGSGKET